MVSLMPQEFRGALPPVSVDTHFQNVPHVWEVAVDQFAYRDYLLEAGLPEHLTGNVELLVRPDYTLGYTRLERLKMFMRNPFFDSISGSCEDLGDDRVRVTIVYGTHYGVNKLLRHETQHAIEMLSGDNECTADVRLSKLAIGPFAVGEAISIASGERVPGLIGSLATLGISAKYFFDRWRQNQVEERRADTAMLDKKLANRAPIIQVRRRK